MCSVASWNADSLQHSPALITVKDITVQRRSDELAYIREMLAAEFPNASLPPVPRIIEAESVRSGIL
jgi:hypothetical protein